MSNYSVQYNESGFTEAQNELIHRALSYATKAHQGQMRKSGKPYITHPIAVAETVAEWGLDAITIAAAILHDVVEDTEITTAELAGIFGDDVAALVDGVTKLAQIEAMAGPEEDSLRLEASNENLRKLLLATAKDYRVILIKLADRLHNLRTLGYLKPEQRLRIARESLDVFAPLADRLGMGQLKCEIEDLSFKYSKPDEYAELSQEVAAVVKKSTRYLAKLKRVITEYLVASGITVESIEGRHKHLYSIYKKQVKVGGDLDKIYDLIAIRLIVPTVADCYQAMGVIHQHYKPLIYRIKDYIAVPKPNGYQSLHTTVFALDGHITEIQIRTPQMHEEAERGLAAHFYYDSQKGSEAYASGGGTAARPDRLSWVGQLADLQASVGTGSEFVENARLELFADRIFVYSPRGDLYELPEGSTPVDFAFAIHTDVGLRTMGAKVNGKMTTLDDQLENRDVVEILTRREAAPNRDWLGFVQTSGAKSRIRAWFRAASRDSNIASGKASLEQELKALGAKRLDDMPVSQLAAALDALNLHAVDDLLAAIGEGSIGVNQAIRRLLPDAARPASMPVVRRVETTGRVIAGTGPVLPYSLAPCCQPIFPEPIVGYITRGSGVTVHGVECSNLPTDRERFVACRWETLTETPERLVCQLRIKAFNRIGLISDITGVISRRRLNIGSMVTTDSEDGGESQITFVVEVPDLFVLSALMKQLGRLPAVTAVQRL